MSKIQAIARFAVHSGKQEEFEKVAAKCMKSVSEKDSGTLQYEWFYSGDKTECMVLETYRDSAAVFEHLTNLGDTLGELLATADMKLEVCGSPSPELQAALGNMGAPTFSEFPGK